ncbi:imm11 family protein [Pontibacillus sp. HMF3514]|uniref:imm11 family protein n=1 Tax=Pontibacillus sp. HMF3514 TaxID=2692425 RepID=UPI00131FFC33|nr:DUF1629 domain-containing protein [Pontibacillus sp. HMF3514]QHE54032.1 hypothetical protein GS400_19270 [Pontibacillus sp. HMF3514]
MLWIWSVPDNFPNNKIGEYVKESGTDRFIFREGRLLTENINPPKVVFECSEDELTDVLPNSGHLILVSRKVLEILEKECPQDIQAFNANIYIGDKKIPNYCLINVVNSLGVVNKEESEFTSIKGTNAILKFDKIIYRFNNLPNKHHIVRNADYKSHVIVSDNIKDAFKKNGVHGVEFN